MPTGAGGWTPPADALDLEEILSRTAQPQLPCRPSRSPGCQDRCGFPLCRSCDDPAV